MQASAQGLDKQEGGHMRYVSETSKAVHEETEGEEAHNRGQDEQVSLGV